MNGFRSFLGFWTNYSMASLICTCNCFYELQVANLHILARCGNSVCECLVCVCVCTVYMSITYLGTDSKPAYFLGINSEECRSLGMDKKPSGVPVGCSLVVVLVRWNIWHFAFWQWICLEELTWGLNFTLLLRLQVAEPCPGSLKARLWPRWGQQQRHPGRTE